MTYIIKIAIFTLYLTLLYNATDFIVNYLTGYLNNITMISLLCQFGIFQGLNLYFSILITGFLLKQTIAYWR